MQTTLTEFCVQFYHPIEKNWMDWKCCQELAAAYEEMDKLPHRNPIRVICRSVTTIEEVVETMGEKS